MPSIYIIQPYLPNYRLDFFKRLYRVYGPSLKLMYSPFPGDSLYIKPNFPWAFSVGAWRELLFGFEWQNGVIDIPLKSGDFLVLSGNPRQLSTLILFLKAKFIGVRVIWWGHSWSSSSRRWRQILRFVPMFFSDAVILYTDHELATLRLDTFAPTRFSLMRALNNGLDLSLINKYRTRYSALERETSMLFVGRLTEKSSLFLLIQALHIISNPRLTLHVIGDGELFTKLIDMAYSLGLSDQIVWHGQILDEENISAVANKCQVFIYPGEVGLSLIHGMAYGLPAIVHDNIKKHMPEIAAFIEGRTGLSFRYGDVDSLASTILTMFSDLNRLDYFSAETKTVVGPSFTTKNMADRFIALINCLGLPHQYSK